MNSSCQTDWKRLKKKSSQGSQFAHRTRYPLSLRSRGTSHNNTTLGPGHRMWRCRQPQFVPLVSNGILPSFWPFRNYLRHRVSVVCSFNHI